MYVLLFCDFIKRLAVFLFLLLHKRLSNSCEPERMILPDKAGCKPCTGKHNCSSLSVNWGACLRFTEGLFEFLWTKLLFFWTKKGMSGCSYWNWKMPWITELRQHSSCALNAVCIWPHLRVVPGHTDLWLFIIVCPTNLMQRLTSYITIKGEKSKWNKLAWCCSFMSG